MKCAPRWVIYSDVCTDCKKSGNTGVSTYIGKTNADPRSFQLAHFMESNWTRVTLPEFEFKVIASYEDALVTFQYHSWTLTRKGYPLPFLQLQKEIKRPHGFQSVHPRDQ